MLGLQRRHINSRTDCLCEEQVLRYLSTTVGLLLLTREATVCQHP